jgi:hypothetical protein
MSPGSVTEKLYFYLAEYQPKDRTGAAAGSRLREKISTCWK